MRTLRFVLNFAVVCGLALSAHANSAEPQPNSQDSTAFPASTALEEGVSPDSLAMLDQLVESFVEDGEVVGAELLVIKNGHSILHRGYGLKDRESEAAMGTGNVFCVRSMTKPLIGTAILMLASDKQLKLGDRVSKFLPNFKGEGAKDITIEHLLQHSSGLPLSLLLARDLTELDGIQAVAELGAAHELEFAPGTSFRYSDQGTDTLTAVIEVVSEMSAADFVRTRILEPLEMRQSACVMSEEHPLRELACSKYRGSRNNWSRFWSSEDAPLFPFFLGSQGLYSTVEDYARFMTFWMRKGRSSEGRLIRAGNIRKALVPSSLSTPLSTALPELEPGYGFLMQLWSRVSKVEGKPDKRKLAAFGHSGSDGTWAWTFPEHKAIVLYFTQSRGNVTGLRVEEALGNLFLGAPFDPNQAAPPFDEYLGYYGEDEQSRYQAVILDGDDVALDTPGRRIAPLVFAGNDRWKFRERPSVGLKFSRDEQGVVSGFQLNDQQPEFRFEPATDLPSLAEVAERVASTHQLNLLEELGPLRIKSTLNLETLKLTGETSSVLAWPNRLRVDSKVNGNFERFAFDGELSRYESSGVPLALMEESRARAMRDQSSLAVFGNWLDWYPKLAVIQRLTRGGKDIVVVRTGDTSATAMTLYVDWDTGRLVRMETVAIVEGMGRLGQRTTFSDFRDASGVLLPFSSQVELANSMAGSVSVEVDEFEFGVEVPEGFFELR